jgi:hypothetical protein
VLALLAEATRALEKAMNFQLPKTPTSAAPVVRVCFRGRPQWASLALLQAFLFDAFFVFNQSFKVTDAYCSCLAVDFVPTDQTPPALLLIKSKIDNPSDFDSLATKYAIWTVTLFNFPETGSIEYTMCFDAVNPL